MEDIKVESNESYEAHKKEGFTHLVVDCGDEKKMLVYIQDDMPLHVAFDGSLDVMLYLRKLLKKKLADALEKAKEKGNESDIEA